MGTVKRQDDLPEVRLARGSQAVLNGTMNIPQSFAVLSLSRSLGYYAGSSWNA